MTNPSPCPSTAAAATRGAPVAPMLWAGGGEHGSDVERQQLIARACDTDAARQLAHCLTGLTGLFDRLAWRALVRLAANEPVDPNDRDSWQSTDSLGRAILARHGLAGGRVGQLSLVAVELLACRQRQADQDAGLDWSVVTDPVDELDDRLRHACQAAPVDLTDPRLYAHRSDQRVHLAARFGLAAGQADDLSRWSLEHPDSFDAEDLRSWRIASETWLGLADQQLEPVDRVDRPVGLFVVPDVRGRGWQLVPVLSVDMIRLAVALGGWVERELTAAWIPSDHVDELLERVNVKTLHAGPKENLDLAGKLAGALHTELGHHVNVGVPADKRDRWGRLLVSRQSHQRAGEKTVAIRLRVVTFPARGYGQRTLGAQRLHAGSYDRGVMSGSAVMELGEAVGAAVARELPLLLSTEAAGKLAGQIRVGRTKGRPGAVTITQANGVSASTRRLVADQAVGELRRFRAADANVTLDAGARQLIRMTQARPLADDPVLLGRQQQIAALKVVGSGVDASSVGTGKTVTTGRALANRAATTGRLRAMIIAEGRLLSQWRDELTVGAPGRGLPPLAPNVAVEVLDDRRSVAAQIRHFDQRLADRGGVMLVANSILDRYASDLQVIAWHVVFADEALRYANPATDAHQALRQLRFGPVADCWLLTATPRGKTAEHLDVLVGLAVGDEAMITERLATREGGDLMDEINAHRLRVAYGPHLVRVTRKDMQRWMPQVRPAKPLAIDPDPALGALLDAIRQGGREAYRQLLEVLRELKTLDTGTAIFKAALAELSRAQGVVLGNVGVFVDASVDPETLTRSKAALAQALVRQGLVAHAMRGGGDGLPLLRGITAQTLAGVAAEQQAIVFAERVWCLRQLAQTLNERHGVRAHVADGTITTAEFEDLKQRFCAGEFPVLCLSRIGHEGHNLQNSSTIVHLDLPWVPTGLEQRVGRAARPGAARGWVDTYIPYIRGGGVEHIVSVLSPRGAEHHQVLDSFEGVSANESTIAGQLGEIASQVAEDKKDAGYAVTAARLKVAAGVFGA
jgi:hypothetical protein